jgi:hypothetical protein
MNLLHRVVVMGAKDSFQSSHSNERNIWQRYRDIIPESFSVSRIVKIFSFPIKEYAVLNSSARMMVNASEDVIKEAGF